MKKGYKSGFVTLIGRPNVGKSTLMNHLIGQKIAITSEKPQTTRNRIQTVYTDEHGQIIFLDTPGIHKAKNKLGEYMEKPLGRLEDSTIYTWEYVLASPVEKLYTFTVTEKVLEEFTKCVAENKRRFVDKTFHSLDILDVLVYK